MGVGLDAEGVFNVICADRSRHQGLPDWLQEGYDGSVHDDLDSGKLALIGGSPTREELLANIGATLDGGMAAGNTLIRFLGFIAWNAPGWPAEDELLEFESQVNDAVQAYPAVIVCTYGVPLLSGRQLVHGGYGTHPVIVFNERVAPGGLRAAAGTGPELPRAAGD